MLCNSGKVNNTEKDLENLKKSLKQKIDNGEIFMVFGVGQKMVATELCVDFYDENYKIVLGLAFNLKK
jgi:hypothetical protein